MLHTILDIESTGLDRNRDIPLACGYLTMNDDFTKVVDGDILYFYQEGQRESCTEAFEVHGLTIDFLRQYENQYTLNLQKLFKLMTKGSLIGFNSDIFDIPMLQNFLAKNGYGKVEPFQTFDVVKIYKPVYGRIKLTKLIEALRIPQNGIQILQKNYYKGKDIKYVAHDATYDVIETMIAFVEARRRELV